MSSVGGATTAIGERSPHEHGNTGAGGSGAYNMQRYNTSSNILQSSASTIQPGASPNDYGSAGAAAAAAAASSTLLPGAAAGVANAGYGSTGTSGSSGSH